MLSKINNLDIRTERLTIRAARECDLASIYAIHKVDEVNRYLPYDTWQNMTDAQAWFDATVKRRTEQSAEQFVLLTAASLVGTAIVFNHCEATQSAEIGYVLGRDYWRQGYISEALTALLPTIANTLNLVQINATVERENNRSIALLLKLGFTHANTEQEESGVFLDCFSKQL